MNILDIKNLTVLYNNHTAVNNVSFTVKPHEYICLVGENGSGKSTLLKTIIGLNKKYTGKIIKNILPEEISYLAQNNMVDLDFPATCREIILTGVHKHKMNFFYKEEHYKKLNEVCSLLNIEKILDKRIGELSGGQRQRVILARALIRQPKLLILDEPCSGLDINIKKELYDMLIKLNKEEGLTILVATHDLAEIKSDNARVICLKTEVQFDGKIGEWKGL
ncbi:MAG: ATP-binding cassette domain-containing protein [Clostridiales bacterium]|nr:ATP-binding cassette domain-containing protein [Clostridiales bacterium]